MLIRSPNTISFEHIIWQPNVACDNKCKACYLHDSVVRGYKGPPNTQILDLIFVENKVQCKQFTIMLNSYVRIPADLTVILKAIWHNYEDRQGGWPDLCIVVKDQNALSRWHHSMGMTLERFLAPLSILSVSSLPVQGKQCEDLSSACKTSGTMLNYNKLIKSLKTSKSKNFHTGCRYADQVYVVYNKRPLGQDQDPLALPSWWRGVKVAQREKKSGADVVQDMCIIHAARYNVEGLTCDAGISKIAVWPDGSVTGCPYDVNHLGRCVISHDLHQWDTWQEINRVVHNDKHPMKFCRISHMIHEYKKTWEDVHKQLLTT